MSAGGNPNGGGSPPVLAGQVAGKAVISPATQLTRLNYFDGKFLRAADLKREQDYLRRLVEISSRAGGAGVVYGLDLATTTGDELSLLPGLAFDPLGRALLLPLQVRFSIRDLIDTSRAVPAGPAAQPVQPGFQACPSDSTGPQSTAPGADACYVVTIGYAEDYCGDEPVYGQLCEDPCVTSSDRPYVVEGIVVRALRFATRTPLVTSTTVTLDRTHLRSRLASAWFQDESEQVGSLISGAGLQLETWCRGAVAPSGTEVPLGVFCWAGGAVVFLDAWTVRRERMEAPPRRYWASRMAMRPWDVFLAQVLQFQCQLGEALIGAPTLVPGGEPSIASQLALDEARSLLNRLHDEYGAVVATGGRVAELSTLAAAGVGRVAALRDELATLTAQSLAPDERKGVLVGRGIVETSPAGYLAVDPNSPLSVNEQVRHLLGAGVDLRVCVCRPDFVAHALEEAQHLDRISLLRGLDNPKELEQVDVLVPNGRLIEVEAGSSGRGYQGAASLFPSTLEGTGRSSATARVTGAAHSERTPGDGLAFQFAAAGPIPRSVKGDAVLAVLRAVDPGALTTALGLVSHTDIAELEGLRDPLFLARLRALSVSAGKGSGAGVDEPSMGVLWTSLRLDRDPRALEVGSSSRVDLTLAASSPDFTPSFFASVQVFGTLYVADAKPTLGGDRVLKVHLSGSATFRTVSGRGTPSERAITLNNDLQITLAQAAGAKPSLTVELPLGKLSPSARVTWGGTPFTVDVSVTAGPTSAPIALLNANFIEDPDVLLPTNRLHGDALLVPPIVAAGLGQPEFAIIAPSELFPPPAPPTERQTVRATLDWVLFHRRRDRDCGPSAGAVGLAPARSFALFERGVSNPEEEVTQIQQALLGKGDATALRLRQVDTIRFGGGSASLDTPSQQIRDDLGNVGEQIAYLAMAEQGPLDGEVLARARLASLESAIQAATAASADLPAPDIVTAVPPSLQVAGTDGAIVLLTWEPRREIAGAQPVEPEPQSATPAPTETPPARPSESRRAAGAEATAATPPPSRGRPRPARSRPVRRARARPRAAANVCHEIFVLRTAGPDGDSLMRASRAADVTRLLDRLGAELTQVGRIEFQADSAAQVGPPLDALAAAGAEVQVVDGVSFFRRRDAETALVESRHEVIHSQLGVQTEFRVQPLASGLNRDCAFLTVVRVAV